MAIFESNQPFFDELSKKIYDIKTDSILSGARSKLKNLVPKIESLSFEKVKELSKIIGSLAARGMTQLGPYNNEALYQQKLKSDLEEISISEPIRCRTETTFTPSCKDFNTGEKNILETINLFARMWNLPILL